MDVIIDPPDFDPEEAERKRKEGEQKAYEAAKEAWTTEARLALERTILTKAKWTTDHVYDEMDKNIRATRSGLAFGGVLNG